MKLMHVFLSVFLTGILVPLILRFIGFKTQSSNSSSPYTFKYPKFLAIFFLIGTIIIMAVDVWLCLSYNDEDWKIFVALFPFYALFAIALAWQFLKALNYQLVLEEDYIVYRNILGIVKRIKYEDISKIKTFNDKSNNPIKYGIYIGKKRVELDSFAMNFNDFPKVMKKRLRKAQNNIKF